ncbi:MAG: YajG family lipoprotein [Bdellovibrionota bacterium]
MGVSNNRLSKIVWLFGFAVIAATNSGCAFGSKTLDVAYDAAKFEKGKLETSPPLAVVIGEFSDKRPETDKIGYKRNKYFRTAKVYSAKPPLEILRTALQEEIARHGHQAVAPGDLKFSGTLDTFWFEYDYDGMVTLDVKGEIRMTLRVADSSGAVLYERPYRGWHQELEPLGEEFKWVEVMNTCLSSVIEQIRTDGRLAEVLAAEAAKKGSGGAAPPGKRRVRKPRASPAAAEQQAPTP